MRGGGGGGYDRDVGVADTEGYSGVGYSTTSAEVLQQQQSLHPNLDPLNRTLVVDEGCPVVCAVDVTGSMGDWCKVIWDKLPMFYGQLRQQGYLENPQISFCAIGDAHPNCGPAPLQVCDFAAAAALDDQVSKLWLDGGRDGGGNLHESYELAAWFYLNRVRINDAIPRNRRFLFITGDESFWPTLTRAQLVRICGLCGQELPEEITAEEIFRRLREKYNVFHIRKAYSDARWNATCQERWESVLGGERILQLTDPRAVVDVMLGAVALTSGARSMDRYTGDMQARGQTAQRVEEVTRALRNLTLPSRYHQA